MTLRKVHPVESDIKGLNEVTRWETSVQMLLRHTNLKKTMSLAKIEVSNNFTLTYFITEPNKVLGEPQFLNF